MDSMQGAKRGAAHLGLGALEVERLGVGLCGEQRRRLHALNQHVLVAAVLHELVTLLLERVALALHVRVRQLQHHVLLLLLLVLLVVLLLLQLVLLLQLLALLLLLLAFQLQRAVLLLQRAVLLVQRAVLLLLRAVLLQQLVVLLLHLLRLLLLRRRHLLAARRALQRRLQAGGVCGRLPRGRGAQAAHDADARRELPDEPLVDANDARAAALGRAAARHRGQRQAGEADVDREAAHEARGEHLVVFRGGL